MKRFIKPVLVFLVLAFILSTCYYLFVLNSKGTASILYLEPEQEYTGFRELVQDPALKGKILYVDVWRTTCRPCLIEFEAAPKLKKYFNQYGNKIAFVYLGADISVPGERFRWKKMIEKKNLTGYHYFMTDAWFEKMWTDVVKDKAIPPQFPQYFIVNAAGQVVDFDAPRPTDHRLYNKLEALLKAKN